MVVGAGGLGCPAAQYLAAAGIGVLGIADFDVVSVSNLHRQILYTPADAGLKKVQVAAAKLQQQNPQITIVPHDLTVSADNVLPLLEPYDLVVDGTDNFDTRYLLNDACVLQGKPLVYGAIYQYEGQVAVWNVRNEDDSRSPNYRDLFPEANALQVPNCAEGGVIPPLAGIIGCLQANEVLKYFTQTGELLAGKVLVLDVQTLQSRILRMGSATKTAIRALPATHSIDSVSPTELREALALGAVELIDVRTAEERSNFNIGGQHVPLSEIENISLPADSSKPVVLYCASGKRSAEAARRLTRKFPGRSFASLEGGMKAWVEKV